MKKIYSESEVRERLRARMGSKTMSALAKEMGISRAYLSRVLAGREAPGPIMLRFIGMKKLPPVNRYEVE